MQLSRRHSLVVIALLLPACATVAIWMDPIRQVGPDTYQITHSMGKYSPVKGVRSGITTRAQDKCTSLSLYYTKVREEIVPGGTLDYTLTFSCTKTPTAPQPKEKTKI